MKTGIALSVLAALIAISSVAQAATVDPLPPGAGVFSQQPQKQPDLWKRDSERGWFWGQRKAWEAAQKKEQAKQQQQAATKTKHQDCTKSDQWTVSCGFINPGHDYDFSQKQFNALTKQFAMNTSDPNKVLQYQRYIKWAVNQAVAAAKTGEWNMIQHQGLNPFISNPVSTFGIRAATLELASHKRDVFEDIKDQGGMLVLFSRSDCEFCHKAKAPLQALSRKTGIPLYDAAIDDACLPGFDKAHCYIGPTIVKAAQHLSVAIVPDLWLYMPADSAWIRISSGLETTDIIMSRILLFFGAAKRAAMKGLVRASGSVQPAVDFSTPTLNERGQEGLGIATGITPKRGGQ